LRLLPKGEIKLRVSKLFGTTEERAFKSADFAVALLGRKDVAADPNLSLLVWYSAADWLLRDPEAATSPLLAAASPLVRQNTCRLMLAETPQKFDANLARLVSELAENRSAEAQADILRGIREGLAGRRDVKTPTHWGFVYGQIRGKGVEAVTREAEAVG